MNEFQIGMAGLFALALFAIGIGVWGGMQADIPKDSSMRNELSEALGIPRDSIEDAAVAKMYRDTFGQPSNLSNEQLFAAGQTMAGGQVRTLGDWVADAKKAS